MVGAQCQLRGRCPAREGIHRDDDVTVGTRATRAAKDGDVTSPQVGGQGRVAHVGHGIASAINGEVHRVEEPATCRALRCQRGHSRIVADGQLLAGSLDLAAVAAIRPTPGAESTIHRGVLVGPDGDIAAVAIGNGVGVDAGAGGDVGGGGVLLRSGAMEVAADQGRAATGVAGNVDLRSRLQVDLLTEHFHRAAGLAGVLAGGVQGAAIADGTQVAAVQDDGAVDVLDAAGLDDAGVVHYAGQQGVFRSRRQEHHAAVGLNETAVFRQIVEGVLVHLHLYQAGVGKGKGDGAARAQGGHALGGGDGAFVADGVADEGHVAAVDGALVDDAAGARTFKGAAGIGQIGVVKVQGGGHQAADVDLGAGAEEDAVGVDKVDLAVGVQVPIKLGAIGIENAVDRD